MSINIGKIDAARHDGADVVRLRREWRNAGLDEVHHEAALAGCRAANILNDHDGGMHASTGDAKKSRLEKLTAAATSTEPAIQSTAVALSGLLRRSGISLADVVVDDVAALDRVFASATKPMSVSDRLSAKAMLYRLGAI
jgi:hypothetical protein